MKSLNSFRFTFTLPHTTDEKSVKVRFNKEDFFKGSGKSAAKLFKSLLTSGVLVAKIKDSKVTGYLKIKEACDPFDVKNLLHVIMASFAELNCFTKEDTVIGVGERFFIGNDLKIHAPKNYWKDVNSKRQDTSYEVSRLVSILKGFYLEDCFHYQKTPTKKGLVEFQDSKRPYGNKDVEASIAFNLGWDWARVLCWDMEQMPDFMVKEAEKLHALVLEELQGKAKSA